MQTREQQYATAVYGQVSQFKKEYEADAAKIKQYGSMAHRLPVLVRTAGLAQALTFVEARNKQEAGKPSKPSLLLLDHLAVVVGKSSGGALAKAAREENLLTYMRLTQQVLAALVWYKRFAQSVLDVKSGDGGGE